MSNGELEALFADPAAGEDVAALARAYLAARSAREQAEEEAKKRAREQAAAEEALLKRMQEAGLSSLKVEQDAGRATVSAATQQHFNLPAGLLEDASVMAWLLKAGGHDLVKRTVHPSTFSAFCRELRAQGRAVHPGVKAVERRYVSVRVEKP